MRPKKVKNIRVYIWLFAVLLLFMVIHLYIYTKSIALKYESTNLKLKYRDLKSKNRDYSSKLSANEALDKIEKKARELGMQYPEKINYIVFSGEAN